MLFFLLLLRQAFYHWSLSSAFCFIFWFEIVLLSCLRWPWICSVAHAALNFWSFLSLRSSWNHRPPLIDLSHWENLKTGLSFVLPQPFHMQHAFEIFFLCYDLVLGTSMLSPTTMLKIENISLSVLGNLHHSSVVSSECLCCLFWSWSSHYSNLSMQGLLSAALFQPTKALVTQWASWLTLPPSSTLLCLFRKKKLSLTNWHKCVKWYIFSLCMYVCVRACAHTHICEAHRTISFFFF